MSDREEDDAHREIEQAKRTAYKFTLAFISLGATLAMFWAINLVRSRWGIEPGTDLLWVWFGVSLLPMASLALFRAFPDWRIVRLSFKASVILALLAIFAAIMGFRIVHVARHGWDHRQCLSGIEAWQTKHPERQGTTAEMLCGDRNCAAENADTRDRMVVVRFDVTPWYEPRYQLPENECRQVALRLLPGEPLPKLGARVAVRREACDSLAERPTTALMRPLR